MADFYCNCGELLTVSDGETATCAKCGRVTEFPVSPSSADPPGAASTAAPLSLDREGRFGSMAVRLGLLKPEDLRIGVDALTAAKAEGRILRLGEVLVQLELMTGENALKVLELQEKRIYPCAGCGRRYNVAHLEQGGTLRCRFCNSEISLPDLSGELRVDESYYARAPKPATVPAPSSTPVDLVPGYRIQRVLGKGGMGTVHLATQISLSRPVAMKVLSPAYSGDAAYVARFLDEARAAGRLQHDNIVRAIDCGQSGPHFYMVMEYAEGETLAQRLKRSRTVPEREAIVIAREVIEGLRYALAQGFLHRDIKPSNLIVGRDGRVKICDLGLTRSVQTDVRLTAPGTVVCSPAYASPEALRKGTLDFRTDVYSLGVTLYEMLTGRLPFTGDNPLTLALKHVNDTPVPPRRHNPVLSEGVQRLVLKMMSKEAVRRAASYEALLQEMDALVDVRPATPAQASRRAAPVAGAAPRRIPVRSIAMIAGGVVGLLILINILSNMGGDDTKSQRKKQREQRREDTVDSGTERAGSTEDPAAKNEEVRPDSRPNMQEFRRKLDGHAGRLNLSGLAAAYCDRVNKRSAASELRENMRHLDSELADLAARLKGWDQPPYEGEWIRATDELLSFDGYDLLRGSDVEAARRLGRFLADVKAGSRARVAVRRSGERKEFTVSFDERPKELTVILSVADIAPSREAPDERTSLAPDVKPAPSLLKDAKERSKVEVRRRLAEDWRRRGSDFGRGLALFLDVPEAELDTEGQSILERHFARFDPEKDLKTEEHAAAAKELYEAIHGKACDRVLMTIALGHLSEACREGLAVGRPAAEAMGLTLSSDKAVWGTGEDLQVYNLRANPAEAEKAAGAGSFRLAYPGVCVFMRTALEADSGYRRVHALLMSLSKKGDDRAKVHVEALAAEVREAAKCRACTMGRIDCAKCKATGKIVVPACSECGGSGWVKFDTGSGTGTKSCPTCHNQKNFKQFGGELKCPDCIGERRLRCTTCKGEEWIAKLGRTVRVASEERCDACEGRGLMFRRLAVACPRCLGLGVLLVPVSKPKARLRD